MTDYPADNSNEWSAFFVQLPPYGKTTGKRTPPPGTPTLAFNIGALVPDKLGASDYTYVDEGSAAAGTTDRDAVRKDEMAMAGGYWFEAVHLMPRDGIDFGNIISAVDDRFELFNAFRHTNITLTNVVNNALPGTELPDLPATPDVMGPMASYIDPLSTNLVPLAQICRALSQGLSSFDTTIDFALAGGVGTLYLGVKGNRIALLTADFDGPLIEILQSKTDIMEHKDGSEQRISFRKQPRQLFEARLYLIGVQRQIVQALLFGWQGMTIALPVWTEQMRVAAAVTGGATDTVTVDSTDYLDLRVGGLAAILKDDTTYDVLTVASLTSTTVTFDQTITNSYSIGDKVVPVRLSIIRGPAQGRRPPVNLEMINVKLQVTENDIGAPTGDVSAFSSYGGKVLLDDFNFIRGQMSEAFSQKVSYIDNVSGIVSQNTPWEKNKRSQVKGFVAKSREALWNIRRLFYALNGRQVSFYIPTFMEDMTASQDLTSGVDTMDISWIGYTRFIQSMEPKATFKIIFTDGTSLVRVVQSSTELSVMEERLVLDTTWPSNKTVAEIARIQFYELVRFDTDDIRIEHSGVGRAKIFNPVKAVFD